MTPFFLPVLAILIAIIGAGWLLGSALVGTAVALIVFGVFLTWMTMNSPLQLQPLPLIAFLAGAGLLIFQVGVLS
jgi:hypothetical protein